MPRRPTKPRTAPPEAGYSLVEVLFASVLLVTAGGGLLRAMSAAALSRRIAEESGAVTRIARSQLEELQAAPMRRAWPLSGHHAAVAPGGSVSRSGPAAPGYRRWFDAEGRPTQGPGAVWEARWRIRELAPAGSGRLAALGFEVLALPASGRGAVARLDSIRVANRE